MAVTKAQVVTQLDRIAAALGLEPTGWDSTDRIIEAAKELRRELEAINRVANNLCDENAALKRELKMHREGFYK